MPTIQNFPATIPEFKIAQMLDKMGIFYEFQSEFFGGSQVKGGIISDFYLPQHAKVLSILGTYWHSFPDIRVKDKLQAISLLSQGIETIWIDEEDALRNPRYYIELALRGISHSKLAVGV